MQHQRRSEVEREREREVERERERVCKALSGQQKKLNVKQAHTHAHILMGTQGMYLWNEEQHAHRVEV